MSTRGIDGLSTEELRETRRGFWDDTFIELLLRRIPDGLRTIVDIGCGLAHAAHALLPRLPNVHYVGVDADEQRLVYAEKLLADVPYSSRVHLCVGRAERLPLPDAQTEFALTCMTLQHLPSAREAVREIVRILAPCGRIAAVEPDNINNLFYFDANLEAVNMAFRNLFARHRRERLPADSAIGPTIATLFEQETLSVVEFFPYAVGKTKKQPAKQAFDRARQVVRIVSANLPNGSPEIAACMAALNKAESSIGSETFGYYCQLVPLFICVGELRSDC